MQILVIQCGEFQWEVEADAINDHRASYYAAREKPSDYDNVYVEEIGVGRNDPDLLIDWYQGNMQWKDIWPHQKRCIATPRFETPDALEAFLNQAVQFSSIQWCFTIEERV